MSKRIFKTKIAEDIDPVALADKLKAGLTTEWFKRRARQKAKRFKAHKTADVSDEARELLMAQ
jgi:hypothetical protein